MTQYASKCKCTSCQDFKNSMKKSGGTCDKCQGEMMRCGVQCYNGNHIGQAYVTKNDDPWTGNHSWSQCDTCGNMGGAW